MKVEGEGEVGGAEGPQMVTRVARFDGWNVLQLRHSLLMCSYGEQ